MKEDLGEVVIDRAIWVALKEAAENHSITELRQHLAALEEMGDAERQMAQRLQPLVQRFDMAGIVTLSRKFRQGKRKKGCFCRITRVVQLFTKEYFMAHNGNIQLIAKEIKPYSFTIFPKRLSTQTHWTLLRNSLATSFLS